METLYSLTMLEGIKGILEALVVIEQQQRVQNKMLLKLLNQRKIEMSTLTQVLALATSITNLTDSVRSADAELRNHITDLEIQLGTAKANAVDQTTIDELAASLNAANGALTAVAAIGANTGVLAAPQPAAPMPEPTPIPADPAA
jgi:hypothetical protein